mmetsp:Transcript_28201/g.63812  ORF Transcript_28201/g.63812 Transcript_28201/m.63812 type:complete len:738 (-) Transcript_28201:345-2558(-)
MSSTISKKSKGVKGGEKGVSSSSMSSSSNLASKASLAKHRSTRQTGMSSRRSGMSASQVGERTHSLIVRDPETGADVTPASLLEADASPIQQVPSGNLSGPGSQHSSDKFDIDSMSSAGFSRSGWSSQGTSTPVNEEQDEVPARDELEERGSHPIVEEKKEARVLLASDEPPKPADLEKDGTIFLSETETFFLFEIPSSCVADDDPQLDAVKEVNAKYLELVKSKAGQDKYSDRAIQTLNMALKNKDAQATPATTVSIGVDVTNYEIHDAILALEEKEEDEDEEIMRSMTSNSKGANNADGLSAIDALLGGNSDLSKEEERILSSRSFKDSLMSVERIVMQNLYHERQLKYRNLSLLSSEEEEGVENAKKLEFLWCFECELSRGRNVSCMAWNKLNCDILAVGYGEFDFTNQKDGMILFWSLKNPEYPQKIIRTSCSVTSLAFADKSVNLLAVGLYDGTVAVYDVRKEDDSPVLESTFTGGKHSDAVWEVRWIDKGSERGEALVSVSSDGRVTQWSMSKGLENTDLIKLKRVANHKKTSNKSEAFISRMASGMCADFNPKDPSVYLVGTEEGPVHKCSVSYNEQYLDSFLGHSGPVYKVVWSPFLASAFLTCSADWAIKLWHQDSEHAMLTMQSSADSVADVQWSPFLSTVFASVSGDGFINIWDMSISTLDPIVTEEILPAKPSSILFSPNSNVIVAGDSTGRVLVYRLLGFAESHSHEEQVAKLEKALAAKDNVE